MAVSGEQVSGLSSLGYLWVIILGLFPQLIGHSSFNYALGYLPASYVSLTILADPVGSAILGIIFLGEVPSAISMLGAVIILLGVGVATRQQASENPDELIPDTPTRLYQADDIEPLNKKRTP